MTKEEILYAAELLEQKEELETVNTNLDNYINELAPFKTAAFDSDLGRLICMDTSVLIAAVYAQKKLNEDQIKILIKKIVAL